MAVPIINEIYFKYTRIIEYTPPTRRNNPLQFTYMTPPIFRLYEAISIGSIAADTLSTEQNARVAGKTRHGVFIKTAGDRLLFLSNETFCGPLTINATSLKSFKEINPGDPVLFQTDRIFFPPVNIGVTTADAILWVPPEPTNQPIPEKKIMANVASLARDVLLNRPDSGLIQLLPHLMEIPGYSVTLTPVLSLIQSKILETVPTIRNRDVGRLTKSLPTILGCGEGLTPSGDDFITGLLLSFNRYPEYFWNAGGLDTLNENLVDAAYQKSTTISANLIECAVRGLADERLIEVLDWLLTEDDKRTPSPTEFMEWGSSSGADAFTGMAAALCGWRE